MQLTAQEYSKIETGEPWEEHKTQAKQNHNQIYKGWAKMRI